MKLALLVETWWIAAVVLRFCRGVFLWSAVTSCLVWPSLAWALGSASLGILCHVGYRGMCHFITETARRVQS